MNAQLKDISAIVGLQVSGSKDILVEALVDFLDSPWDTKVNHKKVRRLLGFQLTLRAKDAYLASLPNQLEKCRQRNRRHQKRFAKLYG